MGRIVEVDPFTIKVPDIRARSLFSEEEYESLKRSIASEGLKVPLQVFQNDNGELILAEGEQRLKAICELRLEKVKIEILGRGTEGDALLHSIATSIKGKPDWISIAYAAKHAVEKYRKSYAEIGRALGKDKSTTLQIVSLTNLGSVPATLVSHGFLSYRKGYSVQFIKDASVQEKVANKAVENKWPVPILDEIVNKIVEYHRSGLPWMESYQKVMKERAAVFKRERKCTVCGEMKPREEMVQVWYCPDCFKELIEEKE